MESTTERYKKILAEKRKKDRPFDNEAWFLHFQDVTFPTVFEMLKDSEVRAMVSYYRGDKDATDVTAQRHLLRGVEKKIESAISSLDLKYSTKILKTRVDSSEKEHMNRFFVRLSSRSPKDSTRPSRKRFERAYYRRKRQFEGIVGVRTSDSKYSLRFSPMVCERSKRNSCSRVLLTTNAIETSSAKIKTRSSDSKEIDTNCTLLALFDADQEALAVTSASKAMQMLLRSERVYRDLIEWLHGDVVEKKFPVQIVCRRWEPRLRHDHEFRGFVYNNELTCLSQYNHYCVFPSLLTQTQQRGVLEMIRHAWQKRFRGLFVASKMKSAVVDFAILDKVKDDDGDDDDDLRVVIIELNPFDEQTGPSLFHWKHDRDLLEGRTRPSQITMRVLDSLHGQPMDCLVSHMMESLESVDVANEKQEDENEEEKPGTLDKNKRGLCCIQ